MLHDFLRTNRAELIARCQAKVATRSAPPATFAELEHGIPLFLAQLTEMLPDGSAESSDARGDVKLAAGATKHGEELFGRDFSIEQVVHDYGDLCQSITELALEQKAPITSQEFGILNIKLDNAIAAAVTEYQSQNGKVLARDSMLATRERVGELARGIGELLNTAIVAVSAIKRGHVGMRGATGAALDRSLTGIRELLDRTLLAMGVENGSAPAWELFELAPFIADVRIAAALDASQLGCRLTIGHVGPGVFVEAQRHGIGSAVASVLRSASRLAQADGNVVLTVRELRGRVLIEVQGEKGSCEASDDRADIDAGLSAIRSGVQASGGMLSVTDASAARFVFTIDIPRATPRAAA